MRAETWKGAANDHIDVYVPTNVSSCSMTMLIGHSYLIYAKHTKDGVLETGWCMGTRNASQAVSDLKLRLPRLEHNLRPPKGADKHKTRFRSCKATAAAETKQVNRANGGTCLFAQFTPQPCDSSTEDTTRKAFALVKALDARKHSKQPSPAAVFSFYCIDGMSVAEIARKCRCSRGTILNRLEFIRRKTGADPVRVRRLSAQFESFGERTPDARARRTSAKGLIYDAPEPEEEDA